LRLVELDLPHIQCAAAYFLDLVGVMVVFAAILSVSASRMIWL
jgi:hypothetical protein